MNATFSVEGTGAPLVLVHGFPLDRRMWRGQSSLSGRWRLVLPDLPGFGSSPPSAAPAGMGAYAEFVIGVMDQSGIDRAPLCGLSMGGYVLFEIWRRAPERVGAMILCDTRAEADLPEGRGAREAAIAQVRGGGRRDFMQAMRPKLMAEASRARPEIDRLVQDMMEGASVEGIVAALQALRDRPDSRPALGAIGIPVLIVVGEEDALTPPDVAWAMHRAIPGSALVQIPATGHLAPLENPEAFNAALVDFLEARSL